ncbi:Uma2 family endonuclease [Kitasatospora fiedleri]|uniref:Uma2 family endonuclease n=1 Tax=Kitasatospora fiedleri TaxID=2991545 RepID=UPI00249B5257|nr:Uma2 family endonuclease [Kitasatospora fiedleri]
MDRAEELTPYPDWIRPPARGYRAEDLDRLPDAPPHTELIAGSLIFTAPRTKWETRTATLLHSALQAAPPDWEVWRSMTVVLDERNRPEPDLMLVDAHAAWGLRATFCRAENVLLVVEVVSEESEERDRETKPRKYAAAGIRHFWRVENVDGRPVVHAYELDPASNRYTPTGIFHDRLKVEHPFPVEIELV